MRGCSSTIGALLLGALASCAGAPGTAPPVAFARTPEPLPLPVSPVAAASDRADAPPRPVAAAFPGSDASGPAEAVLPAADAREYERQLRHELAHATDPTPAAIELAAWLADAERHDEALAAIAAAAAKQPGGDLRIVRAGLWRDLGQRHAAVDELRALRREVGADRLHPHLLFELAELEFLEGDGAAASATLQGLADVHANDPWVTANAALRQGMLAQIAAGKPAVMKVRDVLGNLRGAPLAEDRLQALDRLLQAGQDDDLAEVRDRAVLVALDDPAAAVRARAVARAEPDPAVHAEFLATAFDDPAPLVRQHTIERALAWRPDGCVRLLLAQLDREADAATFVLLCRALGQLAPGLPPTSVAAASSASGRAAVATDYRRRLAP